MDQVDKNILLALQENARISMTELGKMVGLTQPAVTERVRRMEERGIIKDYRTVVAREKMASMRWQSSGCGQRIANLSMLSANPPRKSLNATE